MRKITDIWPYFKIGTKLSITLAVALILFFGLCSGIISTMLSRKFEDKTRIEITKQNETIMGSLYAYNKQLEDSAVKFFNVFASGFTKDFSVDYSKQVQIGEKSAPTLKNGNKVLNLYLD